MRYNGVQLYFIWLPGATLGLTDFWTDRLRALQLNLHAQLLIDWLVHKLALRFHWKQQMRYLDKLELIGFQAKELLAEILFFRFFILQILDLGPSAILKTQLTTYIWFLFPTGCLDGKTNQIQLISYMFILFPIGCLDGKTNHCLPGGKPSLTLDLADSEYHFFYKTAFQYVFSHYYWYYHLPVSPSQMIRNSDICF